MDKKRQRNADHRFPDFLESRDDKSNLLPLIHTTTAYSFDQICNDDYIEPERCKHFKEDIVYLFYGRPAYRVEDSTKSSLEHNWPIVFVFEPEKLKDIKAIFPFDTGAFFFKLYERFFNKRSKVEDFSLPGSLEYAKRLVGIYYGSAGRYFVGDHESNIELPDRNFEAQAIQELNRLPPFTTTESKDLLRRDERSTSIEVQYSNRIDIADAAIGIVIPQPYLSDPYVVDALDRWNIEHQRTYEIFNFHDSENWLGMLYSEVKSIYVACGFLSDD